MALVQSDKQYTYSDYLKWGDDVRCELIDGIPYMSPAPSLAHQTISLGLSLQLGNFLKGKPCRLFTAPCDVRLNTPDGDDTVVQPDLLVVCDKAKLDGKACVGAPDMIIEILSPSTERKDKVTKLNLYQKAGVREYWIVDIDSKTVQVCILKNDEYIIKAYTDADIMPVHVLEGCMVNLADVFVESSY
ncbi:MAG: Uma2 family endonuclease [Peptococcaceae bacterium]|nr:Uma2 family endonuclease [Peptococcaceae bacterium]